MTASQILSSKGRDVFTADPSDSIAEVSRLLHEKRVGALVVTDTNNGVVGVFSERDLVRMVARHGVAALTLQVKDGMSTDVITAEGSESIDDLLGRMTDRRIRHLPVVDGKQLAGVLSIGDLVKSKIASIEADAQALRDYITT